MTLSILSAELAGSSSQQSPEQQGGVSIPGAGDKMQSPFSSWAQGSDGDSQVIQARMKALGKRSKSKKRISLEVVAEADKEGEEGKLCWA